MDRAAGLLLDLALIQVRTIKENSHNSLVKFNPFIDLPGPPLLSSTLQHSSAKPPTPSISPTPQASVRPPQPQPAKPDYTPFPSLSGSRPPSSRDTGATSQFQQHSTQSQSNTAPFPLFSSPAQRQASPFQLFQQHPQNPTPPSSLLDLTQQPQSQPTTSADAEEWTFSSSLPVTNTIPPSSNEITVTNSTVHVLFEVTRPPTSETAILIRARFSNITPQPISDLTFQVAVTKVCTLCLPVSVDI
jgi:ADP-ribosylation factor-binding protein GGA